MDSVTGGLYGGYADELSAESDGLLLGLIQSFFHTIFFRRTDIARDCFIVSKQFDVQLRVKSRVNNLRIIISVV